MNQSLKKITVRVPATSANLGPGFDSLGLALQLYNRFDFSLGGEGLRIEVTGEGAGCIPTDAGNPLVRAMQRVYAAQGQHLPEGLHIHCVNRIPLGSGLGSSASVVVGGLLGGNALLGNPFSQDELLHLAAEIEGHPDNVAPALLGGLTAATRGTNGQWVVRCLPVRPLAVTVVVPHFEFSTQTARAALPIQVPLMEVVENIGRTALVCEAFRSGDLNLLAEVLADHLHQPYRLPLIPGAQAALEAARRAGGRALALSGAGPSLIAFDKSHDPAVGKAMLEAFEQVGVSARKFELRVSRRGAQVRE